MSASLKKVTSTVLNPSKVLSNNDVMNMGLLFALLSPGFLVQIPAPGQGKFSLEFMNMKTSQLSVLTHAVVMLLVLWKINPGLSKERLVLSVLLFVLLSPGFLLELPSEDDQWMNTNRTSLQAVVVHTLVFVILYSSLR